MIQAMAADWRGPRGRRRLLALAISAGCHAVLLALIGLGLTRTRIDAIETEPPPVYLELTPRPLLPGEVARRASRPLHRATATAAATTPRPLRPASKAEDIPAPPQPRPAAPAPQGAIVPPGGAPAPGAATADPWRYQPQDARGAMARSLRLGAAGCRTMDGRLSVGEQQLCDERFNAGAVEAGQRHPLGPRALTPSEARREARFAREGAAALARYERRRAPLGSGAGVAGMAPECVGGNLRGTCPGAHLRPEYQHQEEAPFGGSARPK